MQNLKLFGELLRAYRTSWGLSQKEFAARVAYSSDTVSSWERGRQRPSADAIFYIQKALRLGNSETEELFMLAGFRPPEMNGEQALDTQTTIEPPASPAIVQPVVDPARELSVQFQDLQNSLENLVQRVEQTTSVSSSTSSVTEELLDALDTVRQAQQTAQRITAEVVLPSQEDLQVRLISASSFERLEEYRNEENKWFSLAGLFVGAILGVLINSVTGGVMTSAAWIFIGLFLVMTVIMAWTAYTFQKRAERLRTRIAGVGLTPSAQPGTRTIQPDITQQQGTR
jgi:transcriptional regulator with XRE-family HTH domain